MFVRSRHRYLACSLGLLLLFVGCSGQRQQNFHAKELTEELTLDEINLFLKIVARLPGKKLPLFDSPLAPPARWALGQEKSIDSIAGEKTAQLEQRWSPAYLVQFFNRNPRLRWALASAETSPEVFSGIVLSVGVALAKSSLPPELELEILIKRARASVQVLNEDRRSLAVLAPDEQYQIAQQSLWIPLQDVLTHLPMIPEETLQLVKQNRERLERAFPPEFSENFLIHYDKILNSSGLPFEDLPETGITDLVSWDPEVTYRSDTGEVTRNDRLESADEAFTPPEHLFGSFGEEENSAGMTPPAAGGPANGKGTADEEIPKTRSPGSAENNSETTVR